MIRNRCAAALAVSVALLLQGCGTTPPEPASPPVAERPAPPPEPPVESVKPPEEEPAPQPQPEPVSKPQPPAPVACEPPPAPPAPPAPPPAPPKTSLAVLGGIEHVQIDPPGIRLTARLDTGSALSAVNAIEVREFERDGKSWVKFRITDPGSGASAEVSRPVVRTLSPKAPAARRYVVSLKATIAGVSQFTEFTLADRSASAYPVLIGRNFLRDQAVVDVAHRFTRPDAKP